MYLYRGIYSLGLSFFGILSENNQITPPANLYWTQTVIFGHLKHAKEE